MPTNNLPKTDFNNSPTGCCPKFEPQAWDNQTFSFHNKLFVKANTMSFLHMPINMGSVITHTWKKIEEAGASSDEFVLLSYDPSPWRGEHYFAVTKDVPDSKMVSLSGTFLTKVFEGPFKEAGSWVKEMEEYVKKQDKTLKKLFFYYTTCPKCAKEYGQNYVVAFAQI